MKSGQALGDKWGSRVLGLVPLVVALALGALVLPRAVPPEEVPLPAVDARARAKIRANDRALAEKARRELLPVQVRALGSALREFNTRQAHDENIESLGEARRAIDEALPAAVDENSPEALIALRATQLEGFVSEVRTFEATGNESPELAALAGPFVRRMRMTGWCVDHTILLPEDALRAAYKLTWNGLLGFDARREFALSLDEMRALYAFYLGHPHASEGARDRIEAARRTARTPQACAALDAGEQMAAEGWRIDKIKKLGALDATYPTAFALGVVQFRMGSFEASAESFRDWLRGHPDGPYTLRARNHLRSAMGETSLQ